MSAERTALVTASPDDLDGLAVEAFVARRAPAYLASATSEEVAVRLGVLARMGSRIHPTPVGLLAFGHMPQVLHPEWGLSAVRIRGLTIAEPIADRGDLEGPLPALLAQAMGFVAASSGVSDDEASHEYPRVAVREALVNALVHRDLRKPSRVMLRIFDDRLEVWSPGGFPEGLGDPDEALEAGGVSVPRNPLLASLARGLGLGEQLGRGFVAIRRALAEGTRDPSHRLEIQASPAGVLVRMPSRWRADRDVVPS